MSKPIAKWKLAEAARLKTLSNAALFEEFKDAMAVNGYDGMTTREEGLMLLTEAEMKWRLASWLAMPAPETKDVLP